MRDDDGGHAVLVIEVVVELLQVGLAIVLLLDLLGLVVEIEGGRAHLQLLQKLVPALRVTYLNSLGRCFGSGPLVVAAEPPGVGLVPATGFPVFVPGLEMFLLIQIKLSICG